MNDDHVVSSSFEENALSESAMKGRTLDRIREAQRERTMSSHTLQSLDMDDHIDTDDSEEEEDIFNQNVFIPSTPGRMSTVPSMGLLSTGASPAMPSIQPPTMPSPNLPPMSTPSPIIDDEPMKRTIDLPEYRRLYISEIAADFDDDTVSACKDIKMCMDLRRKWLSMHPIPPQDLVEGFDVELQIEQERRKKLDEMKKNTSYNSLHQGLNNSPLQGPAKSFPSSATLSGLGSNGIAGSELHSHPRKKMEPPYEVFDLPMPPKDPNIFFNMVNGVMVVKRLTADEQNMYRANYLRGKQSSARASATDDFYMSSEEEDEEISALGDLDLSESGPSSQAGSPRASAFNSPHKSHSSLNMSMIFDFKQSDYPVPSFKDFVDDLTKMRTAIFGGPMSTFAYKRLKLLQMRFNFHILLNDAKELEMQKYVSHRDFYNVRKVDTHVHHSACMNQKHLLKFIKHKLKHNSEEAVIFRDGRYLTLGEVFKSLKLTAYDLSIDTLDMHANNTFHRFDRFNLKYNPAGQSRLREIFLKTDNVIGGRYLAEITKEVMSELQTNKYQNVEWRISIYGRKASEWSALARWFYMNRLAHPNVRWLIQIPRLYNLYKRSGEINNFGEMLHNIFQPLFAVSIDPSSNPPLHHFLQTVVGIDSVDDESKPDIGELNASTPTPENWTHSHNPPFGYWMYYTYANLVVLNRLRADRGLNTFQFRPHCGEAGTPDHLIHTFLTAHQINHGINLRLNAGLQYLYYLSQIGIAMSPLSNNKLFLDYNKNPFFIYFQQGLNVSLSTDDPLMLHYTKDALVEEYSVAAQVWKLSAVDQCEIARNSVLQSGWALRYKKRFLGADLKDKKFTNVPLIRLAYREEVLKGELSVIEDTSAVKRKEIFMPPIEKCTEVPVPFPGAQPR